MLERREEALLLRRALCRASFARAVSRLRAGRGASVTCAAESQRALLLEARVGEEPAMLLEEPDHRGRFSIVATWRASSEPRSALVPAWAAAGVSNENEGAQDP